MMGLKHNQVFTKYQKSFSQQLSQWSFDLYKFVRLKFENRFPLKEHERALMGRTPFHTVSSVMPKGVDYAEGKASDGYVKLEYLDLFDYIPKEEIDDFRKSLRRFTLSNKTDQFAGPYTEDDDNRVLGMGRYMDGVSFSRFHTVELLHDDNLVRYAPRVTVSIRNLSKSFSVARYRFYISEAFHEKFGKILKAEYEPYVEVLRTMDVPWYRPARFGQSYYTGDQVRAKAVYECMAELKWKAYQEIRKHFTVHFGENLMFPPVFETYSTNLRCGDNDSYGFLQCIGTGALADYSQPYNTCVSWCADDAAEGSRLVGFCGGNRSDREHMPEIAEYELSDIYSVYLVADTLRRVAERDIANCNKKISKAVRKAGTSGLLKERLKVRRKLYYCYRFISEFTGDSLDYEEIESFHERMTEKGSVSKRCFDGLPGLIADTKKEIDILLRMLDDAAEFSASRSTIGLQWFMAVITFVSVILALASVVGVKWSAVVMLWKGLI